MLIECFAVNAFTFLLLLFQTTDISNRKSWSIGVRDNESLLNKTVSILLLAC